VSEALRTLSAEPLRRFKPYPAYKDSGVGWLGEIPAAWEAKRLKNCVQRLESGGTPESDNFEYWTDDESGIPWVAISDMTRSFHVRDTAKRLTERGLRSKRLPVLPVGTLLYSMYASLGKVALLEIDAVVNQAILGLVTREELVSRDYLHWWLEFMQGHVQLLSSSNTQDNLNADKVRKMPVFVPGPDEQRAIAAFLDRETARIDALVAKKERLIELLQEKRTALITRAVTKGLDPTVPMKDSGVEWLGEIPAHWNVSLLDKVVDPLRRITYGIVQPGVPDPDGILMVRGQNYSRGWSSPEDIFRVSPEIEAPYRRARLKAGDIVVTIVGAGTGNVALVPAWLEGANLTQTTGRVATDNRKMSNRFVAYFLQSKVGSASVELAVKGAAQPGLNLGHLAKFPVVISPLDEQHRIADFIDSEIAKFESLEERIGTAIDHLRELRTALISAAVTGKIDVREEAA